MTHRIALLVAATILSDAQSAFACFAGPRSPGSLVSDADVIVGAHVSGLTEAPTSPLVVLADTWIRFGVVEVLKGEVQFTLDCLRNAHGPSRQE